MELENITETSETKYEVETKEEYYKRQDEIAERFITNHPIWSLAGGTVITTFVWNTPGLISELVKNYLN